MRARIKRRQRIRRLTIIVVVIGVIAILAVSAYILTRPSALDAYVNQPVSESDIAALQQGSSLNLGPSGSDLIGEVQNISGAPLSVNGKPVVLYIGADFCPYCAVQRWGMILSLMRFGTFSDMRYMTSHADGTDYATFTFSGTKYQSNYVVFAGYEWQDRNNVNLDIPPSNYTGVYNSYAKGYPFLDFGGRYIITGALLPASSFGNPLEYLNGLLAGKTWQQVNAAISNGTSPLGGLIRAEANVITAVICKVTGGSPSSVCQQSPISGLVLSLSDWEVHGGAVNLQYLSVRPSHWAVPQVRPVLS